MVSSGESGIAAMVGSNYEYILVGHRTHYLRQLAVKILQSLAVALYVVAVSVQRIGIHQVGKYKASDAVLQEIYGGLNACRVVGGMIYGGYAPLVEYILVPIGGGGLGMIAISFGYQRFNNDIVWICVLLTVIIVQLIQEFGMLIARKADKRINK